MHSKLNPLAGILTALTLVALAFGGTAQVQAEDQKADPSGTWTWSTPGRDGGTPRQSTLKLKVDGEKVMGTITSPGRQGSDPRQTEISDGKIKGDELSFNVVREFNGNKMTQKFHGKVAGDTIKGKMEFDRNGETQTRDWEAKRSTGDKSDKSDKSDKK
jgi:hypothetical protein